MFERFKKALKFRIVLINIIQTNRKEPKRLPLGIKQNVEFSIN